MIVPSIDLQGGSAVQLIGGKELEIHAGDPRPIAQRFAVVGEVAVIDLDRAMGKGDNTKVIDELLPLAHCRVGGGIRDHATAVSWLDKGAAKIIIGTAAKPELLSKLPRDRLIVALDARDGEVVVEGWQRGTGRGILERLHELAPFVGGFLITFVEREGRMAGTDMARIHEIVRAAGNAKVTFAGGITTPEEIAEIDRLGADAQIGMALYSGKLDLGEALVAPMKSDRPDGLWPTVVCDEHGRARETVPRDGLWQAQTPQMFRHRLLLDALDFAPQVTDEASAIEALGLMPKLVAADIGNLKVTYPQDLQLAESILRSRQAAPAERLDG